VIRHKPLLAAGCPPPTAAAVQAMLHLSARLQLLWLVLAAALVCGLIASAGSAQ
jgi:hypothetical protein